MNWEELQRKIERLVKFTEEVRDNAHAYWKKRAKDLLAEIRWGG